MTMGYLCNGCDTFYEGTRFGGHLELSLVLVNDEGEGSPYRAAAQFCDECALVLASQYQLLPNAPDEDDEEGEVAA